MRAGLAADRHARDASPVSAEHQQLHVPGPVPDAHRAVLAPAGHAGAVRAEGHRVHRSLVAAQHHRPLGAGRAPVPDAHRAVLAPAGHPGAVRAEGHRVHRSLVAAQHHRPPRAPAEAQSQTRTVPSWPAPATRVPSGLMATPLTASPLPLSVTGSDAAAQSHTWTVPSWPPLATIRPAAPAATALTAPTLSAAALPSSPRRTLTWPLTSPETATRPSGLIAAARIPCRPSVPRTALSRPDERSHARTRPRSSWPSSAATVRRELDGEVGPAAAREHDRHLAGAPVPHPGAAVGAPGHDLAPARAEPGAVDDPGVTPQRRRRVDAPHVPDHDRPVVADADDVAAVRGHVHREASTRAAGGDERRGAAAEPPAPDAPAAVGAQHAAPAGQEGDALNRRRGPRPGRADQRRRRAGPPRPDADVAVPVPEDHPASIAAEGDAEHGPGGGQVRRPAPGPPRPDEHVARAPLGRPEHAPAVARVDPEHALGGAAGHDRASVTAEGDVGEEAVAHPGPVPRRQLGPAGDVPDANGVVRARRGQLAAVGAEGDGERASGVMAEGEQAPGARVPDPDAAVRLRDGQPAVRGERGVVHLRRAVDGGADTGVVRGLAQDLLALNGRPHAVGLLGKQQRELRVAGEPGVRAPGDLARAREVARVRGLVAAHDRQDRHRGDRGERDGQPGDPQAQAAAAGGPLARGGLPAGVQELALEGAQPGEVALLPGAQPRPAVEEALLAARPGPSPAPRR